MKKILIIGAGLSTGSLVAYLLRHSEKYNWKVRVADLNIEAAEKRIGNHPNGEAVAFNIKDLEQRNREITEADVVISMLPAAMHPIVAKECIRNKKHMLTPSYVSDELKTMEDDVKDSGLIFLNELGVDPGIDHMSAMKVIDKIKSAGGELTLFHSYTGGLVAPDCDNNPWNYKFSWNPRNVVVAGTGIAQYKFDNSFKYTPYHKLFTNIIETEVPGYGRFEVYPNRNSLKYIDTYKLKGIPSIMRGTMRKPGFSKAWNILVQLGCTDDTYTMRFSKTPTYKEFIKSFIPDFHTDIKKSIAQYLDIAEDSDEIKKIEWLGLFSDTEIINSEASPAMILQEILEKKWQLQPEDKDLLVMQHIFEYNIAGKPKRIVSSMCLEGSNAENTAMAFTVGTPIAIATKLLLTDQINLTGIHIPILPEIYNPILDELEQNGIRFKEEEFYL